MGWTGRRGRAVFCSQEWCPRPGRCVNLTGTQRRSLAGPLNVGGAQRKVLRISVHMVSYRRSEPSGASTSQPSGRLP